MCRTPGCRSAHAQRVRTCIRNGGTPHPDRNRHFPSHRKTHLSAEQMIVRSGGDEHPEGVKRFVSGIVGRPSALSRTICLKTSRMGSPRYLHPVVHSNAARSSTHTFSSAGRGERSGAVRSSVPRHYCSSQRLRSRSRNHSGQRHGRRESLWMKPSWVMPVFSRSPRSL